MNRLLLWLGLLLLIAATARLGWIAPVIGASALALLRLLSTRVESPSLWQRFLRNLHKHNAEESTAPPRNRHMSRQEAYEVLGLVQGATREEICAAHRRLIQKVHPDRGGSDYLAGKINQARDTLLSP